MHKLAFHPDVKKDLSGQRSRGAGGQGSEEASLHLRTPAPLLQGEKVRAYPTFFNTIGR
jgi:hypothetical protein